MKGQAGRESGTLHSASEMAEEAEGGHPGRGSLVRAQSPSGRGLLGT